MNVRFSFSVLLAVLLPVTIWICRGFSEIGYEGTVAEQSNPSAGFPLCWPDIPRAGGGKASTSFASPWQSSMSSESWTQTSGLLPSAFCFCPLPMLSQDAGHHRRDSRGKGQGQKRECWRARPPLRFRDVSLPLPSECQSFHHGSTPWVSLSHSPSPLGKRASTTCL